MAQGMWREIFPPLAPPGRRSGGSLTKTGVGTLTLTGYNTYTGGTILLDGKLEVSNTMGSATGSGIVTVKSGTLGGTGTIIGAGRQLHLQTQYQESQS